jgi:hypothetical protein
MSSYACEIEKTANGRGRRAFCEEGRFQQGQLEGCFQADGEIDERKAARRFGENEKKIGPKKGAGEESFEEKVAPPR